MKKYLAPSIIVVFLSFGVFIFLSQIPNSEATKQLDKIISKECVGIIQAIDDNQATIYYVIKGDKFSFGKVGREKIYYYANVGDSLIKRQGSNRIKISKADNSSFKEFVIY